MTCLFQILQANDRSFSLERTADRLAVRHRSFQIDGKDNNMSDATSHSYIQVIVPRNAWSSTSAVGTEQSFAVAKHQDRLFSLGVSAFAVVNYQDRLFSLGVSKIDTVFFPI